MKGSSDEFIDANIQLALAVVKKLKERRETRACIVRRDQLYFMWILFKFSLTVKEINTANFILPQVFPDKPEKRRASELFKAAFDSVTNYVIVILVPVWSNMV